MLTAFQFLTSTIPWFFVWFNLQPIHQFVETAEQVDHRHQLQHTFVVQPQLLHRRRMDFQSIVTRIYRRDGDGDDLLRQAVKFPFFHHDRFHFAPVRL